MKRNEKIRGEVEKIILNVTKVNESLMLLGDFNRHVGNKGPQNINQNGNMILEIIEKHDLIMLNDDLECRGEITWERGSQRM